MNISTVIKKLCLHFNFEIKTSSLDFVELVGFFKKDEKEQNPSIPVSVYIPKDFDTPPKVKINPIPIGFPQNIPHIYKGFICYIVEGSVTLDIFDPVGQMIYCIDHAQQILIRLLNNDPVTDLAEEFYAYWSHASNENVAYCASSYVNKHQFYEISYNNGTSKVLTNDVELSAAVKVLAYYTPTSQIEEVCEKTCAISEIFCKNQPSMVPNQFIDNSVKEFFAWLNTFDKKASISFFNKVFNAYTSEKTAVVLFTHKSHKFGIIVDFIKNESKKIKRRNFLEYSKNFKISRLNIIRLDLGYISERAHPGLINFKKLKIGLVGCGSLGGFVADLLVKNGAGSFGGQLWLIDPKNLDAKNIGRHILGLNKIKKNKAIALNEYLLEKMPGSTIISSPLDAKKFNFKGFDLVIDATGEEALSHYLANSLKDRTSLATTWIEGPGVAIRCLIQPVVKNTICYRCLYEYAKNNKNLPTLEEIDYSLVGEGCESVYTPYNTTVAVRAACCSVDALLANLNGSKNIFFTEILSSNYTKNDNIYLNPHENCPICKK